MNRGLIIAGRCLLALLFVAGAVQKAMAPEATMGLLSDRGLPVALIWPALAFNAGVALALIAGWRLRAVGCLGAAYCLFTSWFHFLPEDGWQMSIFVKNWAIAGGLLVLAGQAGQADR